MTEISWKKLKRILPLLDADKAVAKGQSLSLSVKRDDGVGCDEEECPR